MSLLLFKKKHFSNENNYGNTLNRSLISTKSVKDIFLSLTIFMIPPFALALIPLHHAFSFLAFPGEGVFFAEADPTFLIHFIFICNCLWGRSAGLFRRGCGVL